MTDKKKKDATSEEIQSLAEAAEKLKDLLDDTQDIVPGLGMMIHGIAHAVVSAMAPPEKLIALKEEKGDDFKLSQAIIERDYPEIAAEIEQKGKDMGELFGNCRALMDMSPKDICDQATKLVKHHKMVKMTRSVDGSLPEGWTKIREDVSEASAEEGCDEMEAPLKNGWASNCKGNG